MFRKQNRTMAVLAATAAALAIGASPALAGGDDDDDFDDGEATQVAPVQPSGSGSEAGPSQAGAPQGGIAAGAGGMAEQGPGIALLRAPAVRRAGAAGVGRPADRRRALHGVVSGDAMKVVRPPCRRAERRRAVALGAIDAGSREELRRRWQSRAGCLRRRRARRRGPDVRCVQRRLRDMASSQRGRCHGCSLVGV